MVLLVTGGSGSGKSEYAERRCLEIQKRSGNFQRVPMYYIATMEPFGTEAKQRILRHKKLRAGKGFQTVEQPRDLLHCNVLEQSVVLLEGVSTLLANELFGEEQRVVDGTKEWEEKQKHNQQQVIEELVIKGIYQLKKSCRDLVVVTDDVFADGRGNGRAFCPYEKETLEYMEMLGRVNRQLARLADEVVEVRGAIPFQIK